MKNINQIKRAIKAVSVAEGEWKQRMESVEAICADAAIKAMDEIASRHGLYLLCIIPHPSSEKCTRWKVADVVVRAVGKQIDMTLPDGWSLDQFYIWDVESNRCFQEKFGHGPTQEEWANSIAPFTWDKSFGCGSPPEVTTTYIHTHPDILAVDFDMIAHLLRGYASSEPLRIT